MDDEFERRKAVAKKVVLHMGAQVKDFRKILKGRRGCIEDSTLHLFRLFSSEVDGRGFGYHYFSVGGAAETDEVMIHVREGSYGRMREVRCLGYSPAEGVDFAALDAAVREELAKVAA